MTTRTLKAAFIVAALAVAACDAVSLDPVRADRRAIVDTGGGGSSDTSSSDGGAAATGSGGSAPITPQPSIAFHGAALMPDPEGPEWWSDVVPSDPNIYLVIGTAGMTCAAPYFSGDCTTAPPVDEMIIEVPPALQHAGAIDLHAVRTAWLKVDPKNPDGFCGENNRLGHYPQGTVVILALDQQSVTFDVVGSGIPGDVGPVNFDGEYATSFCP